MAEAVVAASPVPALVHRAHGIEEAVARYEAAMVVMATHGRGGAMRTLIGSVAGRFMQLGDVPVVLIRPAPNEADLPVTAEVAASTLDERSSARPYAGCLS